MLTVLWSAGIALACAAIGSFEFWGSYNQFSWLPLFCLILLSNLLLGALRGFLERRKQVALETSFQATLLNKEGELSQLLSKKQDLEKALIERNYRFNELFEGLPGEVCWISKELRYIKVNSFVALAEGMFPKDFEGQPIGFTGRQLHKELCRLVADFFSSEQASSYLILPEIANGQYAVSLRRFRNDQDALVVLQKMDSPVPLPSENEPTKDSAEKRQPFLLEANKNRLHTAEKNLETARLASFAEMVSGIAHELNNPLAVLHGRIQMLQAQVVSGNLSSEDLSSSLEKLNQTVFRISKIVNGLRSFVRPGVTDAIEFVSPTRAIEDALDFCRGRFHKQKVDIILDVSTMKRARCVSVHLIQILLNLLNNALQATEACSEKWVKILAQDNGEEVVFRIIDSGTGIAVRIEGRIFEPFFTTKEAQKATGLGLSISKSLAEKNGGSLTHIVDSPHTTFELKLPCSD